MGQQYHALPISLSSFICLDLTSKTEGIINQVPSWYLTKSTFSRSHFPFFLLLTAQKRLCPSHRPVTSLVSRPRSLQPLICLQIFNAQTSLPASCITHHSLTPIPNIPIHTKSYTWASHLETRTLFVLFLFFFFFWPHPMACGILVPRPGVEPRESAESEPLDHQGTPENTPDSTPPSSSLRRRPQSSSAPLPPVQRQSTALGPLHPQLHSNCPS